MPFATAPPTVGPKLLTAEEYFIIPNPPGMRTELVRGEIKIVSQPGFRHGKRSFRIAHLIDAFVLPKKIGQIAVECGVLTERGPDTVRGPDISYWSRERLPIDEEPVGYPDTPADFVIEVL